MEKLSHSQPIQFPSIPAGSSPLDSIKKLVILEAELRHASAGLSGESIEEWIEKGSSELDAYWRQQFFLLLLHVAKKNENGPALSALKTVIAEPWKGYVGRSAFLPAESPVQSAAQLVELELPLGAYRAGNVIPLHSTRLLKSLKLRAAAFEQVGKGTVTWSEFASMEEKFGAQLAASGSDRDLSDDDFAEALAAIRTKSTPST